MENKETKNAPVLSPPPVPQFNVYQQPGHEDKPKSKKIVIWVGIGVLAVIIGIVIAVIVSKSPDSDVDFNAEDPVQAMLSEDEWKDAEEYAEQHGHTDDTQDWEMLFMRDEFGEEITSQPYIRRMISGYKVFGQSGQSDYSNLVITLDPHYGVKLHIVDDSFMGSDRILIKRSSGEIEEIPYDSLDDGDIVINIPNVIKRFVNILAKGNIEMAIAAEDNHETRSWRFDITDEFKNIRKALRFLRDVPNVESIYGTIK